MEVMCRDELVTDALPLEVSVDATAAEVLRDACALFGREEEDTALEVGGVVWEADSGDVSAGSLGLEADSTVVLRRDRARVLAIVKEWQCETGIYNTVSAVNPRSLPDWAWDDEAVVFAAVSQCGWTLEFASAALRDNEHIAGAAVGGDAMALMYASRRLRGDEEIVLKAVRQKGLALEYASAALRDNEAVVTAAVEQKGTTLMYASRRLRDNETVALEAVKQRGLALEYASAALQDNETVVAAAVQSNKLAVMYASERLRKRHGKSGVGTAAVRAFRECFAGLLGTQPEARG